LKQSRNWKIARSGSEEAKVQRFKHINYSRRRIKEDEKLKNKKFGICTSRDTKYEEQMRCTYSMKDNGKRKWIRKIQITRKNMD
jgi:hypothetical protein